MDRTIRSRDTPEHRAKGNRPRLDWILIGFLLIAGYFLVTEHRAHVVQYLPLLLLLLCPVLHLLHNHGGANHDSGDPAMRNKDDHHA